MKKSERGRPPKEKEMKFIRACVSVSPEQYKFVQREGLRLSWMVQDLIDEKMTDKVRGALDVLKEEGYLPINEYRKFAREFEEKRQRETEKLTDDVFKRELRDLRESRTKIDDEIRWREIQLGQRKPDKNDSYKFTYKDK